MIYADNYNVSNAILYYYKNYKFAPDNSNTITHTDE